MNPIDDQLDRLFRAAGQAQPGPLAGPAFGLETRALAAWRSAQSREGAVWDMGLLVRGLLVASVIMVISFVPALNSSETATNPFADYLQLTDTTLASDDSP
jgi:hypothetical protein